MSPEELAAHDRDRNASMHKFVFRSIAAIEAETDLVRDVGLDPEKAAMKLYKLRQAREATIEHATARIKRLAAAGDKLAAALEEAQSI
jgi:protein-disulfide isomerase-like protein with CxxC motif